MTDQVLTLLSEIEREIEELPRARLYPAAAGAALDKRLAQELGTDVPAGVAAFFRAYDGGEIAAVEPALDGQAGGAGEAAASGSSTWFRFLTFDEAVEMRARPGRILRGMWPIARQGGRLIALDAEPARSASGAEWPVVQLLDRSVDRLATSLLRFLAVLCVEVRLRAQPDRQLELARERCRRDPHLSEHWVDLAETLTRAGKTGEAIETLTEGARIANPVGPALLAAIGLEAMVAGDRARARGAFEDALACEPLTARDDDARLDAAAHLLVLANDAGDSVLAQRARSVLKDAVAATAGYWRVEAIRNLAQGARARAELALRVVETLLPKDPDVGRLRAESPAVLVAARAAVAAREAQERGQFEHALTEARRAVAAQPEVGVLRAQLAEVLNAFRAEEAVAEAEIATRLNPLVVESWRELGDARLDRRAFSEAVAAFDEALALDPGYGLLHGKRAQALLEQGRRIEALEAVLRAADAGGDGFFLAAVRGDILAAMERHADAAEAYDEALLYEPEDHWALHQAALQHAAAGNFERAAVLFQLALDHDRDGCHQTLVDFAQLMQKMGRIGDAVRLYRKAVAAVPHEPEWRQRLKEAEKELNQAPN